MELDVGKDSSPEGPRRLDFPLPSSSNGIQEGGKRLLRSRSVDSLVEPVQEMYVVPALLVEPIIRRASMQSLPDEMLREIFSYIDHWDQLVARQVCLAWNRVLTTSLHSLAESAVFKIGPLSSISESLDLERPLASFYYQDSLSTFRRSAVGWRNIKLEEVDLSPKHLMKYKFSGTRRDAAVHRLTLLRSTFTWRTLQAVIKKYPNLDKLSILNCKLVVKDNDGFYQRAEEVVEFEKFQSRLKELTLEVTGNIQDLFFYLRKFTVPKEPMPLTSLKIKVNGVQAEVVPAKPLAFATVFAETVVSLAPTLKSLEVTSGQFFAKELANAFVSYQVLQEKNGLKSPVPTLDLLYMRRIPTAQEDIRPLSRETFDRKLLEFLASQPNMTSLALPPMSSLITSTEGFMDALPKKLRSIEIGDESQLTRELFQRLTALKDLKIRFQMASGRLRSATNNNIFPELQSLSIFGKPEFNFGVTIVQAFPNLVSLRMVCQTLAPSAIQITDENLQTIIRNLTNLTTLELSSCQEITDAGLTGIDAVSCKTLWNSRSFYLNDRLEDLEITRVGLPLSYLKKLKELSLKCWDAAPSALTDVGIYFGFEFEDLKELELTGTKKITDAGLLQLGKMNSRLDRLRITSASPKEQSLISPTGIRTLGKALKRMLTANFSVS